MAHENLKQAEHKDFKNLSCDIQESLDAFMQKQKKCKDLTLNLKKNRMNQ